jgi:methionyl-tRNA synthetase
MALAQEANKFLDETAPWKALRPTGSGAQPLHALCAVNGLKVAFAPYVPFSSERLHGYLGFDTPLVEGGWKLTPLPGQAPPTGRALHKARAGAG